MNQFEDFLKKRSAPENSEQFVGQSEQAQFIENAKSEVEGVILYAPLPESVKTVLLERLEQIPLMDYDSINEVLNDSHNHGMSQERKLALWFNRRMRGAASGLQNVEKRDSSSLELAFDNLYCDPSEYTKGLITAWMDSNKPEN